MDHDIVRTYEEIHRVGVTNPRNIKGDIIPRSVLESYINSPQLRERLEKGLITGGMTHTSRKAHSEGIPNADQILLDGNMFFKATDVYMVGNFAVADFVVFENLRFKGEMQTAYDTFITMLKNGIRPPVSSCIRAYWDDSVCREIEFLRGVDVTLQPGFTGSEIIEITIT